jgi:hypothetical protein
MGPVRQLLQLAKRPGCPYSWHQIENVAFEFAWKERAKARDAYLDNLRQSTIESEIVEDAKAIAKRHGKAARRAFNVADREFTLLEKAMNAQTMHGLLSPAEARRLLETAIKTERLLMGEATEIVSNTPDLSHLTLEELRELRAIATKATT